MRSIAVVLVVAACTGTKASPDAATPAIDAAVQPPMTCDDPVALVDVSHPTSVVRPCTEAALRTAVARGGVILFDCGGAPTTIPIAAPIDVTTDTTLDGGGRVTLDGGGTTRILHLASASNLATPTLTVQRLAFAHARTGDVTNTTSTRASGAAIFEDGGSLTVIDCTFSDNHCADTGQAVAGGAIGGLGAGTLVVEDSAFDDNSGSNGGAIGTLDEPVTIVNSTFTNNHATGNGGNAGDGGDGGAISYDGSNIPLTLCGDTFRGNNAGQAGGAVFRVAYGGEPTTIDRSSFDGNSAIVGGGLYLEHTTIDMTASTISHNTGNDGGGIVFGDSAVAHLTNVTIASNAANNWGDGVWFMPHVTGAFLNVTVAGNIGNGLFGDDGAVSLANTIVATGASYAPCTITAEDGGHVMQYPYGQGTLCTASTIVMDPELGALADNGGPTQTLMPAAGSPAIAAGANCPPTDQRGVARATACTLGAVEAP